MANPTPVARISAIQGQAFAKGKDGALRVLHVGDLIFEADVLVAAADSRVDLATGDGRTLIMRANETLTVDAEVAASVQPDMTDSAVLAVGADVSTVIKAIAQGSSLDDLLEDPAAGDNAGSSDGGASFVRLLRIAETIDPQNFDFDAARRAAVDENQGVGNDIAANAAGGSTSVGADTGATENAPTITLTGHAVTEGAVSTATVVATFSGADADAGDTLSYTLLNDPDGYFQIVGSEVRLTTAGVAAVDNDALNLTQLPGITVQVSDGIHTASASDIADITRINDSVPTLSVLAQDITEGAVSTATVVATFSGADADAGDTLSYTLLNDPDGYFQIVGSEVRLTAAGVAAVDNDALNLTQLPAITVQVSDGIHTASASDVADITRINDSVPTLSVLAQDVTEGSVSTTTVVATFSGADADAGDTLSYTLLNDPDGYFQIVGNEVRLTAAGVAAVDNDALNLTQLPAITIQVSDGIHAASASDVADITRINDSVPTLSVLAQDVTEGAVSTATVVATFSGADADAGDTLSYTLLNDPDGYFQIVGTEVRLTAAGVAAVDNDALNLTQLPGITVQVSDGIHTASASDVADITRINDSVPTLSVLAQDITEGTVSTATVVATFSGADADAGDTLSYTLLNDPDGYFQIVGTEVRLTAAGVAAVDNDALNLTQLPAITIQVSDGIHTASASDVSDITRINDSVPTLFVSANDVTEGAVSTATVVATFSGADADAGDTLSYTLLNDPDGYFQIIGSEVRLTAAGVAAVDNDALNLTQLPAITVQVSDGIHTASASDVSDITRINDSVP
ncbi:retention module-containing protein, partial [Propionivibrio sp.]|uniref:retention module-containing protein n=1 Tax=Propionivibrio sp. TaxID=2212460 RepID=UPI00262ADC04